MKKYLLSLAMLPFLIPSSLCADGGEVMVGPEQGLMQTLIMIGIAMLFFYFILWRPEQKRRKALEEQRSQLKKGDKVTAVGIIGVVDKIEEHTVILRMVDGSKIEFLKAAVTDVMAEPETKEE